MNVLFIVYRDFANPAAVGGDLYLWELAKGLSKLNHQVTMVCSRFEGSAPKEIIEGVEIIRVKGFWTLPLEIFKEYYVKLKNNVDVIVEEAIGGQRIPFFCTTYVKKPLVVVWHQRHSKIFNEQYLFPIAVSLSLVELFQARLYKKRTVVSPSKGAKEQVLTLGFKDSSVKVVYDGIGKDFSHRKQSKDREALIVCLGKIRRYKRPDHVILALANIIKTSKIKCRLVIAGKISEIDRGYVNELRRLSEKLCVSSYVDFKFNISETEKLRLLERASILVQPSPVEGFSIVVIEANMCGTPVIVSNGVPSDVVINKYNGLVYPFGNINALSTAITTLLEDKTTWTKLSKNASSWAQKFTWANSVNELNLIINEVSSLDGA